MNNLFERTELLFGRKNIENLQKKRVAVFGIGGVGGHAAEALVRSGIGNIDLIDNDIISESNINRQIFALCSTVGQKKTDAAKARLSDINPDCIIHTYDTFFMPDTSDLFDFSKFDYVIDAIDTVTGKLEIIQKANKYNTNVISIMGAGNKTDPTAFKISDIYKTSVCPLARVMRYELRKRNVEKLKVVYSEEIPKKPDSSYPASCSFVPSVAGLIAAGEVIKDLINQ